MWSLKLNDGSTFITTHKGEVFKIVPNQSGPERFHNYPFGIVKSMPFLHQSGDKVYTVAQVDFRGSGELRWEYWYYSLTHGMWANAASDSQTFLRLAYDQEIGVANYMQLRKELEDSCSSGR